MDDSHKTFPKKKFGFCEAYTALPSTIQFLFINLNHLTKHSEYNEVMVAPKLIRRIGGSIEDSC